MHLLYGIGIIAALVTFAFGTVPARTFVGAALGVLAFGFLLIIGVAALEITRQEMAPTIIHMGGGR